MTIGGSSSNGRSWSRTSLAQSNRASRNLTSVYSQNSHPPQLTLVGTASVPIAAIQTIAPNVCFRCVALPSILVRS